DRAIERVNAAVRSAMTSNRAWILLAACLMNPLAAAAANVVTDWDEKAVAYIQPRMVPPAAYRAMAIVHIAMFDAVNSIEPLYRSYQNSSPAIRYPGSFDKLSGGNPRQRREVEWHQTGRGRRDQVPRGAWQRRRVGCGRLSSRDQGRSLYPHGAYGRPAMAGAHAVRDDQLLPVSAAATGRPRERAMGQRL